MLAQQESLRVLFHLLLLSTLVTCSRGQFFCRLNEVRCPSGIQQCIISTKICNGIRDCSDGSDENPALCSKYNCSNRNNDLQGDPESGPYSYQQTALCPSKKMCTRDPVFRFNPEEEDFITFFACNGGPVDCADGSDEDPKFCRGIDCKKQPFGQYAENCPSRNYCLYPVDFRGGDTAVEFLCDGRKNCPDGSDEWPSFCKGRKCSYLASDFRCNNGACVRPEDVCNGIKDCSTGEDEAPAFCLKYDCPYTEGRKCVNNRTCLPEFALCDGRRDCDDGSDERPAFCRSLKCLERAFKCKDGLQCASTGRSRNFPEDPRCTGEAECKDRSDEDLTFCSNASCFKCPNGRECTFSEYSFCDGVKDCSDGSDENPAFCKNFKCPDGRVKCKSTNKCVNGGMCDGRVDCEDGSDEERSMCAKFKCPERQRKCPGFKFQCLREELICNGNVDCINGGDENPAFCKKYKCPEPNINCKGKCTFGSFCDSRVDCPDGSDEDPAFCLKYKCPRDSVACKDNKECFPAVLTCTGEDFHGCEDGTKFDDAFCSKYDCGTSGNFKCEKNSTRCLSITARCNGIIDCPRSKSDENPAFCRTFKCDFGQVKCPDNLQCVDSGLLCDGKPDCKGGIDEDPKFCLKHQCTPFQFSCADGLQCIDELKRCNRKVDCRDGSDEKFCLGFRDF